MDAPVSGGAAAVLALRDAGFAARVARAGRARGGACDPLAPGARRGRGAAPPRAGLLGAGCNPLAPPRQSRVLNHRASRGEERGEGAGGAAP
eukprot:gene5522-5698_t